uniref:Uncharacterized protein n=1 Tax=Panagrolaimus sp. PS1159 TaxID=55785 RepID=A0AC35G408_9BILA
MWSPLVFFAFIVAAFFAVSVQSQQNFQQLQYQLNRAFYIDPRYFGTQNLQFQQGPNLDVSGLERFERQLLAGRR